MVKKAPKRKVEATPLPARDRNAHAFRTLHFARDAKHAGITDAELCDAIRDLERAQGDELRGGVWKKRLAKNRYRAILIAKQEHYWIFVYLFAKKDRENIEPKELVAFKKLSKDYAAAPASAWRAMLQNGDLKEICHDDEDQEGAEGTGAKGRLRGDS